MMPKMSDMLLPRFPRKINGGSSAPGKNGRKALKGNYWIASALARTSMVAYMTFGALRMRRTVEYNTSIS